jgi:peptidyl-dipeptidase Dcp
MNAHPSIAAAIALTAGMTCGAADFGPGNPLHAPSSLPFHAPPFDKIKDEDYQPAIEAGMARQIAELQASLRPSTP